MKAINKEVSLQDYVPRYLNQAINFTGDDMGSDRAMIIVFLYIIIVIMAFVFGITSSNTIMKESHVIGTLLASGYTRAELIRHYMSMPIIVTLIRSCRDRKYFRLYRPERCMCRYVLRKLQSSDLYYHLECGSFPSDNRDSDHFDDPCKLLQYSTEAFSFST